MTKLEVYTKYSCSLLKYHGFLEENQLCSWFVKWNWLLCRPHETPFLVERTADRQWVFWLVYLAHSFSKMNDLNMSFQGKQIKVTVAYDKNLSFQAKPRIWKTHICHYKLDSFPILKDFSDEIDGDMNVICLYGIMKCVNIWKNYITQWTIIFHRTHEGLTKLCMSTNPFKMQDRGMDLM